MKLGKAIVIIFAAISLVVVPISIFYINTGVFTLEIQGRFFDAKVGAEQGFGFFKFVSTGASMFSPQAWNDAFTGQVVLGLAAGTWMMILWYSSMGLMIIGIIVAFFKTKLSGLFFVLAFITDGMQALIWYLGMKEVVAPTDLIFPIPVSVLFLLITFILAFTSKKKESYYYSPGYSYGYGRR